MVEIFRPAGRSGKKSAETDYPAGMRRGDDQSAPGAQRGIEMFEALDFADEFQRAPCAASPHRRHFGDGVPGFDEAFAHQGAACGAMK